MLLFISMIDSIRRQSHASLGGLLCPCPPVRGTTLMMMAGAGWGVDPNRRHKSRPCREDEWVSLCPRTPYRAVPAVTAMSMQAADVAGSVIVQQIYFFGKTKR